MPFGAESNLFNDDRDVVLERNLDIPWSSDPAGSYVYFDCTVGQVLDSGIVIHNRLPQVDRTPDTLASASFDDPNLYKITDKGVSLLCRDQYTDIMQRMGHSRYWFRLWGQALRIGYKVPIPGIKKIGGVDAVPYDKNPQWAFNRIFPYGNYGGVVLWHAQWSLWYTTLVPPVSNAVPATTPYAPTVNVNNPPKTLQAPFSEPDDNSNPGEALRGIVSKPGRR